jgi:hypothetical protein
MLVFNNDLDCFCTSEDQPRCIERKICLLNHIDHNFNNSLDRGVKAGVDILKKSLKEGISDRKFR